MTRKNIQSACKVLALALVASICLVLSGCQAVEDVVGGIFGGDDPAPTATPDQQQPPQDMSGTVPGDPDSEVSFGLQAPGDPVFGDVGLGQQIGNSEGLYTILDDGYAYLLDPDTMEPTGEPLDPISHEPISAREETEPSAEPTLYPVGGESLPPDVVETPAPSDSPAPENTPEPTPAPTASPIPVDIQLPNTGKFVEDD